MTPSAVAPAPCAPGAPGRRRSSRLRVTAVVGSLLIAAGLSLSGYLAWQYYGTPLVAEHRQREVIAALEHEWRSPQPSERETSGAVTTSWGTADAIIEIPRFGSDYRVPVFEGTSTEVLKVGFGHFTGSAAPGAVGNFALAAHRVTHAQPLRHMPDMQIGDLVTVITRDTTYVYKMTTAGDALVVPMTAHWVTTPLPTHPDGGVQPPQRVGGRLITLTTCAELFHTDLREIAFGVLDRTYPTAVEWSG